MFPLKNLARKGLIRCLIIIIIFTALYRQSGQYQGNWSKRRQPKRRQTKTSTNRNVDRPKRRQIKTSTNLNVDKPKRRQTETSTNQNVDKPKRRQTETSTNRNVDKPKRRQTKTSTNQNVDKPKRRQINSLHYVPIMYVSVPITT